MTVVGLDDTDSREAGMCTTYAAAVLAERLRERGASVARVCLVRLNPAVEYKTRGNAALAVHTDAAVDVAFAAARALVDDTAVVDDPRTNPGVVALAGAPESVPEGVADLSAGAVRDILARETARDVLADASEAVETRDATWGDGRGLVGALAATGAWRAWAEDDLTPTYEHIVYRPRERWGTERSVDAASVFAAADEAYPTVWDTVDRGERETVCVPHTPGPVLYGIRGDAPDACRRVAAAINSEPAERARTFVTNQGTDAHLRDGTLANARDGRAYRLDGVVSEPPETRRGGHVFCELRAPGGDATGDGPGGDPTTLACAAFEPTKRFRDRVRALRVGDHVTACGEVSDGTLKLEKFAVRDLVRTEPATPDCPDCGRSMSSAGRGQGYRCRDCGTAAPGKVERAVERDLERGWYEVPPCARRHVAKPLVRGGFDAPTHPER
ncbi:tRNA(Ile)(2)-agmatinylcytidine synthase [Haloglomus salinum]|uniref:tRNA(Ile)(2)-agmatinylcytidine synthase n=1 Tax=Haloglomus salinum TaxID=2962673 RepID=UPI0020C9471F|nr:tRNA(Ile)(2)-agmatinylcytidine synthase [Haloglomus salinum]